jgi:hypothetical protein
VAYVTAAPVATGGDEPAPRSRRDGVVGLVAIWIVAAAYLGRFAYRGWVPHDEGLLAHTAERVLRGELPHRDFADAYTGGLAYLHALAFRVLGVELASLRTVLLVATLAWIPAVWAIARRFVPPRVAVAAVALAVAWSVPSYFAALPSWYVLFLATYGAYALLRHLDRERASWLLGAGLCGGLAFLVKTTGLLYVAAGVLFVVELAHRRGTQARGGRALEIAGLVAVVPAVAAVLADRLGAAEMFHLLLPVAAVTAGIGWRAWRDRGMSSLDPWWLAGRLGVFALGFVLPIVPFVVGYARSGALVALWRGVFLLPQRRIVAAAYPLPPVWTAIAVAPYALVLALPGALSVRARRVSFRVGIAAIALVLVAASRPTVYRTVWYSARALLPVVCVLASVRVAAGTLAPTRRAELVLLTALTAFMALVQYPYAHAIYFCYVAPFLVLTTFALVASQPGAPSGIHFCAAAFYLAFAIACVNTGSVRTIGVAPGAPGSERTLALRRAGLAVPRPDAGVYRRLVRSIQRHAPPGAFIYAAPDCPEVYFLADRPNPTPTIYDFLDADFATEARARRILATLGEKGVDVVVVDRRPEFSPRMSPALLRPLAERYPNAVRIGWFTVRWRTPPAVGPATAAPPPAAPRS